MGKTICEISKFMAKLLSFPLDLVFLFVLCSLWACPHAPSLRLGFGKARFTMGLEIHTEGVHFLQGLLLFLNEFASHEPDESCHTFRNGVLILNYCRLYI